MTMPRVGMITSVERRRRWSRKEKARLVAASFEPGAERAAIMYTLIGSAKLSDVDPQDWLANVVARIAYSPQNRLAELLPWNWRKTQPALKAA